MPGAAESAGSVISKDERLNEAVSLRQQRVTMGVDPGKGFVQKRKERKTNGQITMCNMIVNFSVGLLTGALSSWVVAWFFYRFGRIDSQRAQWAAQIDGILFRLAMLDPKRKHSVRPGDGVDDTSHALLCMAAVLASSDFSEGAELAKKIANEMVDWCSPQRTYDEGEAVKSGWAHELSSLRAKLTGT